MNSLELTASITAPANAVACNLTSGEVTLVASMFVQPGDTLATIAAQRTLCEERAKAEKKGRINNTALEYTLHKDIFRGRI